MHVRRPLLVTFWGFNGPTVTDKLTSAPSADPLLLFQCCGLQVGRAGRICAAKAVAECWSIPCRFSRPLSPITHTCCCWALTTHCFCPCRPGSWNAGRTARWLTTLLLQQRWDKHFILTCKVFGVRGLPGIEEGVSRTPPEKWSFCLAASVLSLWNFAGRNRCSERLVNRRQNRVCDV